MKNITFAVLLCCGVTACGQIRSSHFHEKHASMETNKINNPTVKAAIDAWQNADQTQWLSFFMPDAKLLDDGNPRDFKKFSSAAIGHERFLTIDKVEENGTVVYGQFHSDTWGDFKTYFRFHMNEQGKFYQLDIGQADY